MADTRVPTAAVSDALPMPVETLAVVVTLAEPVIPEVPRVSPFAKPVIVAVSAGFAAP